MGVMRFLVHPPANLEDWPGVYPAYLSGPDGRIFPTRIVVDGNVLCCIRPMSESARLNVTWPVRGFGSPVISTASLPEREEPYLLPLELARGKIGQLRDQISSWEVAGMTIPAAFSVPFKKAHRCLQQATANQDRPAESASLAAESLQYAFESAELAVSAYATQRLSARRKRSPQLPAAMGCSLDSSVPPEGSSGAFLDAFTAALVPAQWKQVEGVEGACDWSPIDAQVDWCHANRLLIYGGPLLDLSPRGLPDWLEQWKNDLPNLQSLMCGFVESAVARYAGRIRIWDVVARGNTGGALNLSEEHRLALVARTLDVARQVDDEVQVMLRIDQPWGDYQSRLSPMQFVDALVRSGIGLSAVNLELTVGYLPGGSAPRDLFDLSRMLDLWSALGIPLCVTLGCPSNSRTPDRPAPAARRIASQGWVEEWSETAQVRWIDAVLPLLLAKQAVVGIFWTQFADQSSPDWPHGGLVRDDGTAKPSLARFAAQRRAFGETGSDPSIRVP